MNPDASGGLIRFVIAGRINRDFILPLSGPPQVDVLGGNLAYAATGLQLWGETAGLVGRVDPGFALAWFDRFKSLGFDVSGIKVISEEMDTRRFLAHEDLTTTHTQTPIQYFANRGLPFPPSLLGYQDQTPIFSSRSAPSKYTLQISDIPENYLETSAIHICPIDYLSHLMLPSVFRQGRATTITLASDPGYMSPTFWEEIPGLLSEITAFITTEKEIRNLFQGRQTDLWKMIAELGTYGPEYVVVHSVTWGYCLFDSIRNKRWIVPNYQAKIVDPTGAADAFAGGFLAGYRETYDPLEAALIGSISASFVVEGSGVFYALDAMPGLKDARLRALRELVSEVAD